MTQKFEVVRDIYVDAGKVPKGTIAEYDTSKGLILQTIPRIESEYGIRSMGIQEIVGCLREIPLEEIEFMQRSILDSRHIFNELANVQKVIKDGKIKWQSATPQQPFHTHFKVIKRSGFAEVGDIVSFDRGCFWVRNKSGEHWISSSVVLNNPQIYQPVNSEDLPFKGTRTFVILRYTKWANKGDVFSKTAENGYYRYYDRLTSSVQYAPAAMIENDPDLYQEVKEDVGCKSDQKEPSGELFTKQQLEQAQENAFLAGRTMYYERGERKRYYANYEDYKKKTSGKKESETTREAPPSFAKKFNPPPIGG